MCLITKLIKIFAGTYYNLHYPFYPHPSPPSPNCLFPLSLLPLLYSSNLVTERLKPYYTTYNPIFPMINFFAGTYYNLHYPLYSPPSPPSPNCPFPLSLLPLFYSSNLVTKRLKPYYTTYNPIFPFSETKLQRRWHPLSPHFGWYWYWFSCFYLCFLVEGISSY